MKKIALIDDDFELSFIIKENLEKFGYNIEIFNDPIFGFEKITNNSDDYSLILLDFVLPKLDGGKIAKLLKSNSKTKNIPIILITTRNLKDTIEKATSSNIDDILFKPFEYKDLEEKIKKLIKNGH